MSPEARLSLSLLLLATLGAAVPLPAGDTAAVDAGGIAILPAKFTLRGPVARQRLVVEALRRGEAVGQVEGEVVVTSTDEMVVRVEREEDGSLLAVPAASGVAALEVTRGRHRATASVRVVDFDDPIVWSFRNDVQPVLTRAGCNSGACHGAAAGKNGFKLSLRGYDPEGDFLTLTRRARGRRIVPADPGRSLILTKPTGLLPHKGGVRFDADSREYRILSGWIASGTPGPGPGDPRVESLTVLPGISVLEPGTEQQLVVRATFSDGRARDVTPWVKYSASNASVATVDERGKVRVVGPGEGAITAWYQSRIAIATVSVPFEDPPAPALFTAPAGRRNSIDELVLEKLRRLNIPPSPPATDAEFLRRVYLDTIGVLPSASEVRAFLRDRSPGKRERLIRDLLERPEYVDYWTYRWSDLLLVNSQKLPAPAMWAYYSWIRDSVASNKPWDLFVRELVTARGSTLENGAANFFILHKDPLEMSETVSVAFLGMSINCARCHNHPLEKWTNDQYYAMANLFARVRVKAAPGAGNSEVFTARSGDVIQPLTGRPRPPRPLDGEALELDDPGDRRVHLASWLTAPENPYFGRAITNRVWANFMGVGLVENVDDLRLTNPASNEKLLSAMASYLAEHDYDLKALMRLILESSTYQRTSRGLPGNRGDRRFYSRYYPRRLMAEVLLDALSRVTGVPTDFPGYPGGWRALQLPDASVASYFLESFGRPDRQNTCECERSGEPSMAQVLHIANGSTINEKLKAKNNSIERWLAGGAANEKILEELYLGALARYPSREEKRRILAILDAVGDAERRPVLEDLWWGVLSSREFLFNH